MKKTITKTKRQPTEWEKIFANNTHSKMLISKIYKEIIQLKNKTKQITDEWIKNTYIQNRILLSH